LEHCVHSGYCPCAEATLYTVNGHQELAATSKFWSET
jgi:hypothetical protein